MERWSSTTSGSVDDWLDQHADELPPDFDGAGALDEHMAQIAKVRRLTFDAGWARYGWPEQVGGLGGSTLLRAYLSEALTARDLVYSGVYSMPEVLGPSVITFAPPELSATMLPPLLRGDEVWCQGFSEPGTGSNLGSLTCRAVRTDEGWRVTGQKVWTSLAQYAQRCVLLTRTGTIESAHRGITALFVDMDTPGITARPIETMHGEPEFCEVFFDDVLVPFDRTLGRKATAGRSPWTCCPTSAARRSGSAPRSSTAGCRTCSTRPSPAWSIRRSWAR